VPAAAAASPWPDCRTEGTLTPRYAPP
jgi:hypothetical protein